MESPKADSPSVCPSVRRSPVSTFSKSRMHLRNIQHPRHHRRLVPHHQHNLRNPPYTPILSHFPITSLSCKWESRLNSKWLIVLHSSQMPLIMVYSYPTCRHLDLNSPLHTSTTTSPHLYRNHANDNDNEGGTEMTRAGQVTANEDQGEVLPMVRLIAD